MMKSFSRENCGLLYLLVCVKKMNGFGFYQTNYIIITIYKKSN